MAVHWILVSFFSFWCIFLSDAGDIRFEEQLRKDLFGYRQPISIHTRPSVRSNQSSYVDFGISLISLEKVDFSTETLSANIWVRMVWYDYTLHWNEEDYGGLGVIRISGDLIWKPDIVLSNSAEATMSKVGGSSLLLIYPNGQVLWVPSKQVHISCSLELKNFPFDEHACHFKFRSWSHDGSALKLKFYSSKRQVDLSDFWDNEEWIVSEDKTLPDTDNRDYQEISFSIHLKRRSSYYVFTLGIPIVLAWVLTLVLFWLPPMSGEKITLGSFIILYYVIFLVHLQWTIPHNGSHVPRIIAFCGHSLFFSGLSVIITAVTVTISRPYSSSPVPYFLRKILTSWVGHFLCLGPSRKGVSMGAKLLRSSNVELSINSDSKEGSTSSSLEPCSEWILVAMALDRFVFIIYSCIVSILVISILLC